MPQSELNSAALVIVGRNDVIGKDVLHHLFVARQVAFQVVGQFLFQRLEFRLGILIVPLEFHQFLQVFHRLFALGVVGEAALHDSLAELGIFGIGDFEL